MPSLPVRGGRGGPRRDLVVEYRRYRRNASDDTLAAHIPTYLDIIVVVGDACESNDGGSALRITEGKITAAISNKKRLAAVADDGVDSHQPGRVLRADCHLPGFKAVGGARGQRRLPLAARPPEDEVVAVCSVDVSILFVGVDAERRECKFVPLQRGRRAECGDSKCNVRRFFSSVCDVGVHGCTFGIGARTRRGAHVDALRRAAEPLYRDTGYIAVLELD